MAFSAPSVLPALVIAVPASLAMLVLVLGRRTLHGIPALAAASTVGICLLAAVAAGGGAPLQTVLGGWAPPLGIVLRVDGLGAVFLLMTAVVMATVALMALPGLWHEPDRGGPDPGGSAPRAFWGLLLFLWAGLNTVFVSRDLFNLYVALELTGLGGIAMVALSGSSEALRAQIRYLLLATAGSLCYLMGVALLYAELGVLDMDLAAARITASPPATAAAVLMTLGLMIKTAIWPLHFWLPPAHSNAPPVVSAILSGLVVKASLYLLIRLWFELFPEIVTAAAWTLLGLLGSIAVLWGSVLALRQERLKLMIAYSTVAQLGYMMFLFPLAAPGSPFAVAAWNGAILQVVSHGIAKAAMFLSAGAIAAAVGGDERNRLAGGTRRLPVPIFAFALAGLSVMALPPSGGFLGKWLLLRSALGAGEWWLAFVLIAGGLLAAAYILRFILPAFLPVPAGISAERLPSGALGKGAMALALVSLLMGIGAEPVLRLIEMARSTAAMAGLP